MKPPLRRLPQLPPTAKNTRATPIIPPHTHLHVVNVIPGHNSRVRATVEEDARRGGATVPDLVVLDAHVVAPLRGDYDNSKGKQRVRQRT